MLKRLMAAIGVATLLLSATTFAADKMDVSGEWQLTLETEAGPMKPRLSLQQKNQKITGTYRDEFGSTTVTGTLDRAQITLEVKAKIPNEDLTVTLTGTVEGDTMKGRVVFGELGEGSFTGARLGT